MFIAQKMSKYSDTIYALSSPQGKSAIAIIRVSGKGVLKIIRKITKIKKIIPNKTNLLFIKNKDVLIDQALIIFFKSPLCLLVLMSTVLLELRLIKILNNLRSDHSPLNMLSWVCL